MFRIKYFRIFIFVLIFLVSSFIVYAGYPAINYDTASGCKPNSVGVRIGDFCYDCGESDLVCPNDFSPGTCTTTNPDADCLSALACSEHKNQANCGADTDGCTWCEPKSGTKTLVGEQCKEGLGKTCEYKCVGGLNDAQCSDGQVTKTFRPIEAGTCYETTTTCTDQCTFSYSNVDASCSTLYTNACDDGSTKTDLCGNSCKRNVAPYTTSGSEAGMCNDGVDNDCDGEKDWDTAMYAPNPVNGLTRGPQKGDNNCAVGVTSISVSKDTAWINENIEVTCTTTVSGINSIDAFIGNEKCGYIENSWSGNNVKFLCPTTSLGSKIIKCTIDKTKSYQSGNDQIKIITVIQGDCSTLSQAQCGNAPGNKCEWCNECSSTGNKYSGGNNRCVAKGSCSYILTKDKCQATCDATVGCSGITSCDSLDKCYNGAYRNYENVKQWCDLNNGQCKDSSCTLYKEVITDVDKDGYDIQCDNDCNDNNQNINPSAKEVCNSADDNCNSEIDEGLTFTSYYIDNDGDKFGSGNAINACASPGANYATKSGDCNDNNQK